MTEPTLDLRNSVDQPRPGVTRSKRRWILVLAGLAIAAIAAAAAIKIFRQNPIPKTISGQVGFTLYYPKRLPAGFKVDPGSWRSPQNNVIIFFITYSGGKRLGVSQQPKPANYDVENFYQTKVDNLIEFSPSSGHAAIGTLSNGAGFGSLVTNDNTWIILTAPKGIDSGQLRKIVENLAPVKT